MRVCVCFSNVVCQCVCMWAHGRGNALPSLRAPPGALRALPRRGRQQKLRSITSCIIASHTYEQRPGWHHSGAVSAVDADVTQLACESAACCPWPICRGCRTVDGLRNAQTQVARASSDPAFASRWSVFSFVGSRPLALASVGIADVML